MFPRGPLAFLASDIEGSTRLWEAQPGAMSLALQRHNELLAEAIEAHGGRIFKTMGDGLFASFPLASNGAAAALQAQRGFAEEAWPTDRPLRVRMAVHTGPAEEREGDYFGPTINRLARLLAIGHGGQVLLSESAALFSRDGLPPGAGLREMGRHRLKDLDQAEAVAMLTHAGMEAEFPPLRSLDARPNNLPRQMTSFVGRERELQAAGALLAGSPFVTLVGTGGTGKTRLALQMAAEASGGFPDGVWLVELAALTDPALVPQAIATAAGVREEGGRGEEDLTAALVRALRDRATLLVLDNCEHLLDACAAVVGRVLQGAPRTKILATSREALNLPGEATFRVPTLSVPPRSMLSPSGTGARDGGMRATKALGFDAVRLLVDRIRLVDSGFELSDRLAPVAAGICGRLDGIPLAIELAASRAKALSLERISSLLDDRFRLLTAGSRGALPRQQTLRATIEWSHELLEPGERVLLRRVAVFAGGWTLEAAEAVCADEELPEWEVLDGLMRLVEKSLVAYDAEGEGSREESGGESGGGSGEGRYRLLESVRQYAGERLGRDEAPGAAEALRERHAAHYADLVVSSEEGLQGPEQARWLETLEREHDNIRAALALSRERPELCERALSLVGAIGRFWTVRGYLVEGRGWIESLLACASGEPSVAKATAWRTAGQIAYWQGDAKAGRRFGEESLAICRTLGDEEGEIKSLFRLGFACLADGELGCAREHFEDALDLSRGMASPSGIPHLLNAVGEVALAEGALGEARARFDEALAGFRGLADRRSIASVLKNLASVAGAEREYGTAFGYLAEGLRIRSELNNLPGVAATLESFAVLAGAQGRHARAATLLAAAEAIHEAHGSRSEPVEAPRIAGARAAAAAALGSAAFEALGREGSGLSVEAAIELAAGDGEPAPPLAFAAV